MFSPAKSDSLREERVRGASIDDKLQDLIGKSDVIVNLLQGQLTVLNDHKGRADANLSETLKERETTVGEMESLKSQIMDMDPRIITLENKIAVEQDAAARTKLESELAGLNSKYNDLVQEEQVKLAKSQTLERYIEKGKTWIDSLQNQAATQMVLINKLQTDTKQRVVLYDALTKSLKTAQQQDVAHRINEIGVATDQQAQAGMAAIGSATNQRMAEMMESHEGHMVFACKVLEEKAKSDERYRLNKPADVLDIRTIEVEADTASGHIVNAGEMTRLIERFTTREDGWWDDTLVAKMITLAERVCDIGRHPLALKQTTFRQGNFHTTHFGGLYVFPEAPEPGVIRVDVTAATKDMPIRTVIDLANTKKITEFLEENRLIESVFDAKGLDAAALLRQRLDFILIDHLATSGEELTGLTRQGLRRVAQRNASDLPDTFHALADVLRWTQQGGRRPKLGPGNPAWFYTLRARAHPDRDLVNMLLAHLTPLDVRQLFICHKAAFYDAYSGWSETKRSYVADFLANEYMIDKAGTRAGLFGPEPLMEEPDIELGPWGPRRTD